MITCSHGIAYILLATIASTLRIDVISYGSEIAGDREVVNLYFH